MVSSEECDRLLASGAKIKPDADISGIGVILAFLITAYASFVAILAAYVCGMVEPESLSLADVKVMRIRSRTERHPRMHRILRQTIIVLSDQQIVTGIAIMTAGFVGLRSGQISVYHYQIVLYLAWLSSSVHLSWSGWCSSGSAMKFSCGKPDWETCPGGLPEIKGGNKTLGWVLEESIC